MSNRYFEQRDVRRDGLRSACAAMEDALAHIPEPAFGEASPANDLRARWAELLVLIAMEPARLLRACPVCKQAGMLEATRCMNCWTKLAVGTASDVLPA
jgi:hypothetical protein